MNSVCPMNFFRTTDTTDSTDTTIWKPGLREGDTLCRVHNIMSEHMDNPRINFSPSDYLLVSFFHI